MILYNRRSLHYWLNQVVWEGLRKGQLRRQGSMAGVLSNGVERSSIGARPLVRVYSPRGARRLLLATASPTVTIRHFRWADVEYSASSQTASRSCASRSSSTGSAESRAGTSSPEVSRHEAGSRQSRRRGCRGRPRAGTRPTLDSRAGPPTVRQCRHGADRRSSPSRACRSTAWCSSSPIMRRSALELAKEQGFVPRRTSCILSGRLVGRALPTGYSAAGPRRGALGDDVAGFAIGDRVACAGAGFANHAEVIVAPR